VTRLGESDRERQSHVSKSDDAYLHGRSVGRSSGLLAISARLGRRAAKGVGRVGTAALR
jgi:hypothetical protein